MAKGDRKFRQITQGVRLTPSQQRTIRKQLDKGVDTPTLRVAGQTVTVQQLRTAQLLISQAQAEQQRKEDNRRKTAPPERLRYNSQGVATTRSGVQVTRAQARAYRDRARQINKFNDREQFRTTLENVVLTSRNDTDGTTFMPTRARNAPLPYQRVDFRRFTSQAEFEESIKYQDVLYNPKARTSARSEYLGDVMKENWIKALESRVGKSEASDIVAMLRKMDGLTFRALTDSGALDTVGDVYYGDAAEIAASLDNYHDTIYDASNPDDLEDIGLL